MNERDFLQLAVALAAGPTEAHWRTAVGRAYYAAFHVARGLLADFGFTVPRADKAHTYLAFRLQNSGNPSVDKAGADQQGLRRSRNHVDYDLQQPITRALAAAQILTSEQIIKCLDAARSQPTQTQITDAMRVYERDVLQDVTWQKP